VELVDGFVPERQEAREIFRFLLASFIVLEKTKDPIILNLAFEVRLLNYLGYQPQIDRCTSCGTVFEKEIADAVSFSAQAGGVICPNCTLKYRDLIKVDRTDLQVLGRLGGIDLRELDKILLPPHNCRNLQRILRDFIEARLERPLKSEVFLGIVME
jgi:DNA repair protein RecO (recombination protein O)